MSRTSKDGLALTAVKMLCVISNSVNKLVLKIIPTNKEKALQIKLRRKNKQKKTKCTFYFR